MIKNMMIRSFMTVVLLMMTTVAMADGATFKISEGVVDAATKPMRSRRNSSCRRTTSHPRPSRMWS